MQALGLIETRGLLPAIECLDIMLKTAQVELMEKCNVGGGLVTIAVTGDVGAVQASVEAGASAVQRLGSDVLIARHFIPRPHNDIESIFGWRNDSNIPKESGEPTLSIWHTQVAEQTPELDATPDVPMDSGSEGSFPVPVVNPGLDLASEDISPERDNGDPAALDGPFKHRIDALVEESGLDKAMELLETMTAVKLRELARECSDALGMSLKAISKANKVKLLERLRQYYQQ
uniref:BMC domain-containing protein n=1 Tax=Brevibacillus daliensis TaxID=2892995 RepID=UPI0027149844|nr:BMC domain-containing protein [Brevibacillus daliensis]